MAGVVGINAVLTMAGSPIRGQSLRLTPLTIGTPVVDNLNELFDAAFVALGYQTQKLCEPRKEQRIGVKRP